MLRKEIVKHTIVYFDGVCYLCNSLVNFLIKIDTNRNLSYSPLQSEFAKRNLENTQINFSKVDSIIVQKRDKYFIKSEAISLIIKELNWYWRILLIFNFLPISWTDKLYDYIAEKRYKWFGIKEKCMIPTEGVKSRFLID